LYSYSQDRTLSRLNTSTGSYNSPADRFSKKKLKRNIDSIFSVSVVFYSLKKNFSHSKSTGARCFHFFFGFFKIDCCSINQTKYPFFCLIMTHLVMNHQISHWEVKFFYKKKLPWVILFEIHGRKFFLTGICPWGLDWSVKTTETRKSYIKLHGRKYQKCTVGEIGRCSIQNWTAKKATTDLCKGKKLDRLKGLTGRSKGMK